LIGYGNNEIVGEEGIHSRGGHNRDDREIDICGQPEARANPIRLQSIMATCLPSYPHFPLFKRLQVTSYCNNRGAIPYHTIPRHFDPRTKNAVYRTVPVLKRGTVFADCLMPLFNLLF